MARNPEKARCKAKTAAGRPCRGWAMPGSDYCRSHQPEPPNPKGAKPGNQNARKHGAYSAFFDEDDLLALASAATDSLEDEIAFTRVVCRRLAKQLQTADFESTEDMIRLADSLFRGTGRIASLLKVQRSISGQAADGIAGAIAQALDELSTEWNVEL